MEKYEVSVPQNGDRYNFEIFRQIKLLELLPLKFDIKNLATCVTAMLIFQGPIFWQRKTKNDKNTQSLCFHVSNLI